MKSKKKSRLNGVQLIAQERLRQIQEEGWSPEHDEQHRNFQLSTAACCYANMGSDGPFSHPRPGVPPGLWPWDFGWWKPSKDPIRNLVKAGALIAAEIDRIQWCSRNSTLRVVNSLEGWSKTPQDKVIFLAGPTPRSSDVISWRPEALEMLRRLGFRGVVFVPECAEGKKILDKAQQYEWEHQALTNSDVVVFWVPRNLSRLPGFTTNVEFGRFVGIRECVYGRPEDAVNCGYLDWLFKKLTKKLPRTSLQETLEDAVDLLRA